MELIAVLRNESEQSIRPSSNESVSEQKSTPEENTLIHASEELLQYGIEDHEIQTSACKSINVSNQNEVNVKRVWIL